MQVHILYYIIVIKLVIKNVNDEWMFFLDFSRVKSIDNNVNNSSRDLIKHYHKST